MAKRSRRRVIVLDSSDDDDDDDAKEDEENNGSPPVRAPAPPFLPVNAVEQIGVKPDVWSKRKHQRSEETSPKKRRKEPNVVGAFEGGGRKSSGRNVSSKNVSHGTLPLEIITKKPAANARDSSRSRNGRVPATSEDQQKPQIKHEVDDRLWVDKYTPRNLGELVIHSKKIAEVKEWVEGQLVQPYGASSGSRVLVLTGPAGVGKTAVVRVLADVLGVELFEWTTPVPELWQEYSHHAASGGPYVSKLDEFEAFLERGRKMSSLPIVQVSMSTSQKVRPFSGDDRAKSPAMGAKVLVIDDLPTVNDQEQKQRLSKSLFRLALCRDFPTIVVVTDEIGTGVRLGEKDHQYKDVLEALERGGARKIAFNPVTVNAMKKLLTKVQLLEKCRLSSESISAIAESSAGDIRQALTSLQFLCLGCQSENLHHLMWDPGGPGSSRFDLKDCQTTGTSSLASVGGGRDYSLSLFHALGKLLHNKRLTDEPSHSGTGMISQVREELQRPPLDMEEPEVILSQAHTDPATLLAFLHENVLQFIDEDATDDVMAVSTSMSDTDFLLGAQGSFRSRHTFVDASDFDPSQIATVVATSVAARGVLFGNGHPAPRRWQSLRAPALWQVERQNKLKKMEISTQAVHGIFDAKAYFGLVKVTELYPFSHHLSGHHASSSSLNVVTVPSIDQVSDSMHRAEYTPDLHPQSNKQDHYGLDHTLMKMSVEDDIEDPDN